MKNCLSLFALPARKQGRDSSKSCWSVYYWVLVLVVITPFLVSVPQADGTANNNILFAASSRHPPYGTNTASVHACKSSLALCLCCRRKAILLALYLLFSSCTPSVGAKILRPLASALDQHAFCVQKSCSYMVLITTGALVFSMIPSTGESRAV